MQIYPRTLGLIDAGQLNISVSDASALVEQINTLSDGSWRIDAPHTERWYLRTDHKIKLTTHPLASVLGREIGNYLPTGEDKAYWLALGSEIQMLLHDSPVNQSRESRGEKPLNSLWLWGEGIEDTSSFSDKIWTKVYSDEEMSFGFAKLQKTECELLTTDVIRWLDKLENNGRYLLVFSKGHCRIQYGISNWTDFSKVFDQQWLAAILPLVKTAKIEHLDLIVPGQWTFSLGKRQMGPLNVVKSTVNNLIKYFK